MEVDLRVSCCVLKSAQQINGVKQKAAVHKEVYLVSFYSEIPVRNIPPIVVGEEV